MSRSPTLRHMHNRDQIVSFVPYADEYSHDSAFILIRNPAFTVLLQGRVQWRALWPAVLRLLDHSLSLGRALLNLTRTPVIPVKWRSEAASSSGVTCVVIGSKYSSESAQRAYFQFPNIM